jgi:hypothetical protein
MPKQVVLPEGLSSPHNQHHSKDPWHQFEGLVFALIVIHMAAFAFWCYLLYKSRSKRAEGSSSGSSRGKSAAGQGEWKSPKEILKAYQKAQLGKA